MRTATLNDLLVADDTIECECPHGFDRDGALSRIRALQPALERLTNFPFEIDDRVQDASFFADLFTRDPVERPLPSGGRCIETFIAVRFSYFGDLCAIWSSSSVRPLTDDERSRVSELVCGAGFVYAPPELLELPYSGSNPHLKDLRDWWLRFFDYL